MVRAGADEASVGSAGNCRWAGLRRSWNIIRVYRHVSALCSRAALSLSNWILVGGSTFLDGRGSGLGIANRSHPEQAPTGSLGQDSISTRHEVL